jgi:hypothetical protein
VPIAKSIADSVIKLNEAETKLVALIKLVSIMARKFEKLPNDSRNRSFIFIKATSNGLSKYLLTEPAILRSQLAIGKNISPIESANAFVEIADSLNHFVNN